MPLPQVTFRGVLKSIWPGDLFTGLGVTIKHLFRPPVTVLYPKRRREFPERFRGNLLLVDLECCIACTMCQKACPSQVYTIESEGAGKEKHLTRFQINIGRCMFCELCVEACPKGCIQFSRTYEGAVYERRQLVFEMSQVAQLHRELAPPKPVAEERAGEAS